MTREEYLDSFISEIINAGKDLIDKPLPQLQEKDFFLFKETGNRLIYEGEYFGRRKYLTVFGIIAEFIDNDSLGFKKIFDQEKIFNKVSYIIDEVCKEKFWALPAHVNFEHLDECTVDLFAAETAGTLAEMLYLFEDKIDSDIVKKAKEEIIRRVLKPFWESTFPYSWWEFDKCNWSAVCAGSIGMAAIYMDKLGALPGDWKKPCLDRVCEALKCYMSGMEEDGACTEGLGYFSYGMSYFTGFAELYKAETGINLMDNEKVHLVATFQQKCYFGQGISISFSDGSDKEYFLPGLTSYLKANYEDVEIPDFSVARGLEEDACYRWLTNERNIKWMNKYDISVENVEKREKHYLLPSAQWMIVQDEYGNGFAAKGGNNAENHNHNDIGSFLCVYEGEMLLSDLGAGEYTKDYFSDKRYSILCNSSRGHSVPLINNTEQLEGSEHKADLFEWNEKLKELRISYAKAYEAGIIEGLERKIACTDSTSKHLMVEIQDHFICSEKTNKITEVLVTSFEPKVEGKEIIIFGKKNNCKITGFSTVPEVIPQKHALHDGKVITVYLIHWQLELNSTKEINERIKISFGE